MFNGSIYCVANLNACVGGCRRLGWRSGVVIPPGVSISLTSTLTLGNSNGVALALVIERGGQVVINVPGGVPAIQISKGGSSCPQSGYRRLAESGRVPSILMGPSANVADLIANAIKDGTQGTANIDGCFMVLGDQPVLDSGAAVRQNARASDTIIEGFP